MRPEAGEARSIDWRSRRLWMTVGHISTAAWMLFVLARTGGNVDDPFFELIFVVPLAAWIAGLVLARILSALGKDGSKPSSGGADKR